MKQKRGNYTQYQPCAQCFLHEEFKTSYTGAFIVMYDDMTTSRNLSSVAKKAAVGLDIINTWSTTPSPSYLGPLPKANGLEISPWSTDTGIPEG